MKKYLFGFAALAVLTACGNKTDAASNDEMATDSLTVVEEPALIEEETMVVETPETTDSVAPETKDTKASKDEYTTTASGLKYKVLKKGNGKGKSPVATDNVTVHYEGKLTDGTVFDSSYQRGEPATFPLNRVIAGWTEGVQLMQEGDTYEFYIPYQLAYGVAGGGPIPPKADLIFKVELIKVN